MMEVRSEASRRNGLGLGSDSEGSVKNRRTDGPKSSVKEDWAAEAVSKLEILVMMRSVRPITALVHGRKDPMWAK